MADLPLMPTTPSPQQPAPTDPSEGQDVAATTPSTAGGPPAPAVRAPRRSLVAWVAGLTLLVVLIDQATKYWAEANLAGEAPLPVIGSLLQLRLLYNDGAALGIGAGYTGLLTVVVIAVVVVIVRITRKIGSRGWAVALGLLLGGAIGNLIDRLFREPGFAQGHVVDFIDYAGFFVGNVADIAIVAAAVMIAILSIMGIGVDGQRHVDEASVAAPGPES
jgi:signal peptidase II